MIDFPAFHVCALTKNLIFAFPVNLKERTECIQSKSNTYTNWYRPFTFVALRAVESKADTLQDHFRFRSALYP